MTSSFHRHVAEVILGADEGLEREPAANCDNLFTLSKAVLTRRRGRLGPASLSQLDQALAISLGLD